MVSKVIICNFGLANWAWDECREQGTIAVMDDDRVHPFWVAGDREGYIKAAQRYLHAPGRDPVAKGTASRWFNLTDVLLESDGDLWIHKDGNRLWWSLSTGAEASHTIIVEPRPRFGGKVTAHLYQKPCTGWTSNDKLGRPLTWGALHMKAQDFLVTQATFLTLGDANAAYAHALIDGDDLSRWHDLPTWQTKHREAKTKTATHFDRKMITAFALARAALETANASGATSIATKKDKEFRFASETELRKYIEEMMDDNEMSCAVTGVEMQLHDGDDKARWVSLDRIDSGGHYERGNLQLVCRFANRWKSAEANDEFLRLIALVRTANS